MKKIVLGAALALSAAPAWGEDQVFTCHFDDRGDFSYVDPAPASAAVGSVGRGGSGKDSYSYVMKAKDDSLCPGQVPLGTKTATTFPLVGAEALNCGKPADASGSAPLGGSVTLFRAPGHAVAATLHLIGGAPNGHYKFSVNCNQILGNVFTDAKGAADVRFSFVSGDPSASYTLGVAPVDAGLAFQSVPAIVP